jgi:hypothetical protein
MNARRATLLALALPLVGLALLWGWSDWRTRQGTDWEVRITGYDPRDLLRGHYVLYRYEWPGMAQATAFTAPTGDLCLTGTAPTIARVRPATGDCPHRLRADQGTGNLASGRYYVAQVRARELERGLADPNQIAILRFRLRDDGLIVPRGIEFRPRAQR